MKKDILLNIIITFIIGILGFIVNNIFGEYLGSDSLGLMRLFTQLVGFLNLAELGVGTTASYSLYKPLEEKNIKKINIIMGSLDKIYNKIAIIIIIVGILFGFYLPFFIKEVNSKVIYLYWALYVLNTSFSYLFAKYISLFNANQEYRVVRKIQGLSKIITTIFQIITLIYLKSFVLFIILMILENIISFVFYKKYYKDKYNYITESQEFDFQLIKDIKNIFCHKIGSVIINNTDYILISKFLSVTIIAIYSSYLMVYQMLLLILGIITPVIRPRIGRFIVLNTKFNIYIYWKKYYVVYLYVIGIICIVSLKLYNPFIMLWMGEEYLLTTETVILILINLYITVTKRLIEIFKFNSGFFDDKYAPLLESLLNLIISLGLIKKIGLNGVILGTVVSNLIISDIVKPILVYKKCFDRTYKDFLYDNFYYKLLSFTSMFLSYKLINLKFEHVYLYNWVDFFKFGVLFSSLSIVSSLFIFMFDKEFRELLRLLKINLIKGKK